MSVEHKAPCFSTRHFMFSGQLICTVNPEASCLFGGRFAQILLFECRPKKQSFQIASLGVLRRFRPTVQMKLIPGHPSQFSLQLIL